MPTSDLHTSPLRESDFDELHAVQTDPRTWRHAPSSRPTSATSTHEMIAHSRSSWDLHGFGMWAVRDTDGLFAGTVGAIMTDLGFWNLGYRLSPFVWGLGIASTLAGEAVTAAVHAEPNRPAVARVLSTNPASRKVAENAGLSLIHRGPSKEGPERLIHADRDIGPELLAEIISLG